MVSARPEARRLPTNFVRSFDCCQNGFVVKTIALSRRAWTFFFFAKCAASHLARYARDKFISQLKIHRMNPYLSSIRTR
jgi:hypothetical protein